MIIEALFISLIISICLFFFEFFKMRSVFESTFHGSHFLPGLNVRKPLGSMEYNEKEVKAGFSEINSRVYGIEDRLSKQQNIIEKLIKEISGLNA